MESPKEADETTDSREKGEREEQKKESSEAPKEVPSEHSSGASVPLNATQTSDEQHPSGSAPQKRPREEDAEIPPEAAPVKRPRAEDHVTALEALVAPFGGKVVPSLEFLHVGGRRVQFHCNYCRKDITSLARIHCAECPDFDLCVECFSVGVELGDHRNSHPYRVTDCLSSSSLVEKDWTAEEEFLLLEAIERFGLGNWKDIADYVGTKTEKKCQTHYQEQYILSPTAPLPLLVEDQTRQPGKSKKGEEKLPKTPGGKGEGPSQGKEERESGTTSKVPGKMKKSKKDSKRFSSGGSDLSKLPGHEICGFMPLRGDFEVEHDNDAELILADMEFNDEDHPSERALKLRIIQIYNKKLDERERRKQFVIERGLLDYRKQQAIEKRRPREERELVASLRPFARFHSADEHKEFVDGMLAALRLRKRISQLQHYRSLGLRTLAECERYEVEKRKKDQESSMKKSRQSASYLYETGRQSSLSRERTNSRWLNRDKSGSSSLETPTGAGEGGEKDKQGGKKEGDQKQPISSPKEAQSGEASILSAMEGEEEKEEPLDIDSAPGAEMLSTTEKKLCSSLRMLPRHYLVVKEMIVRESFQRGYIKKEDAKTIIKIDEDRTGRLYDFFVSSGWVSGEAASLKRRAEIKAAAGGEDEGDSVGEGRVSEKITAEMVV